MWAYNERTHSTALRPVTQLFRYARDTVYVLHTATGEALRTTSDHPFYVRGQWVRVKRLRVGDSLVSQSGQRHVLRRIDRQPEHVTVYNFTVDELHTYFVGTSAILVHNSGCPPVSPKVQKIADQLKDFDKNGQLTRNKNTRLTPGNSREANITIRDGGDQLNIRLETHPLTPKGPPVRHINVEPTTPSGKPSTGHLPNGGHLVL